jgi:hypothetical protein
MTKSVPLALQKDDKPQSDLALVAKRVGDRILLLLGRPDDLVHLQVKRLWDCSYRVNVLTGTAIDATIRHSYFVKTNEAGEILTTRPNVKRMY